VHTSQFQDSCFSVLGSQDQKGMLHGYSEFLFVFKKACFAADKLTAAKWRLLITI
jgi:hypothetical protein